MLKLGLRTLTTACLGALMLSGCGMAAKGEVNSPAAGPANAKTSLTRSLFSRDVTGSVSEHDLQKILDSKFELDLPARVGIVALDHAFDPAEPAGVARPGIVAGSLTKNLRGSEHFASVTDVSTELGSRGSARLRRATALAISCSSAPRARTALT